MGVTSFSLELLTGVLKDNEIKTVCELGAQNLYDRHYPEPRYASEWYEAQGIDYTCIDLNGENNALKWDLNKKKTPETQYDLVTDFGTSEHIGSKTRTTEQGNVLPVHNPREFYNCLRTKHLLCKDGGIIVSENPKTKNWIEHGAQYYTKDFYLDLANSGAIEILDLGEHPAMGNTANGWNVYCIARKIGDFPSFEKFKTFTFKLD